MEDNTQKKIDWAFVIIRVFVVAVIFGLVYIVATIA